MPRSKPKTNRKGDAKKSQPFDRCQTPLYALDPLGAYLPRDWVVWECAAGEGNLVRGLRGRGYTVIASDVLVGTSGVLGGRNFFNWKPLDPFNCIVTNPPYSIKYRWMERCYALGKPFALLMPVETIGAKSAHRLFCRYGFEWIVLSGRVNFKMPKKGYAGGGATFPVAWFTWGLNIGQPVTFTGITPRSDEQLTLLDLDELRVGPQPSTQVPMFGGIP